MLLLICFHPYLHTSVVARIFSEEHYSGQPLGGRGRNPRAGEFLKICKKVPKNIGKKAILSHIFQKI